MKNIYGISGTFLSKRWRSLAGVVLALVLGLVWNFFYHCEESSSADCSMFSTAPAPHDIEKMLEAEISSSDVEKKYPTGTPSRCDR
jgi:hypothetical protein